MPASRPHRFLGHLATAIPLLIALAAAALVLSEAPPAVGTPLLDSRRPTAPVVALGRDPAPLLARVATDRLRRQLEPVAHALPADSCLVVETASARFAWRDAAPLVPASGQKLLTAAAALSRLGPGHRFTTSALAGGPVEGGVLAGDLHIVGGGDPGLVTAAGPSEARDPAPVTPVEALVDELVEAGITQVTGSVLADDARWSGADWHPDWPSRYRRSGIVAPVGALRVRGAAGGAGGAAAAVADSLRAAGIRVDGASGVAAAPADARHLAAVSSPPVSELVVTMLRESDNDIAEALGREVGVAALGRGTFATATTALRASLAELGLLDPGTHLADSSGLSRRNAATCRTLLRAVSATGPIGGHLRAGLATAGVDGTLRNRWTTPPIQGRLRAKTGTLFGVSTLVGEVDADGGVVRFALIVNTPDGQPITAQVRGVEDSLIELLTSLDGMAHDDAAGALVAT